MDKWFASKAMDGDFYRSSNIVATATTALATAHTGLVLSNAPTSGVWLVVRDFSWVTSIEGVAPAYVGLQTRLSVHQTEVVHTTPCVVHNGKEQGSNIDTGTGKVDESATLPEVGVAYVPLGGIRDDGAAALVGESAWIYKFGGTLILLPGTFLATFGITQQQTGYGSVSWAEIKPNSTIS